MGSCGPKQRFTPRGFATECAPHSRAHSQLLLPKTNVGARRSPAGAGAAIVLALSFLKCHCTAPFHYTFPLPLRCLSIALSLPLHCPFTFFPLPVHFLSTALPPALPPPFHPPVHRPSPPPSQKPSASSSQPAPPARGGRPEAPRGDRPAAALPRGRVRRARLPRAITIVGSLQLPHRLWAQTRFDTARVGGPAVRSQRAAPPGSRKYRHRTHLTNCMMS